MLRGLLMKAPPGWSAPDTVSTSPFPIVPTPSAPASEASRLFLTGAATPPVPGGEHPVLAINQTFIDRRYSLSDRGNMASQTTCVFEVSPDVVDAGAEMTLRGKVSCSPACDLRGHRLL